MKKESTTTVKKADSLTGLWQLKLSKKTSEYLEDKFCSLDEAIFEGRIIAFHYDRFLEFQNNPWFLLKCLKAVEPLTYQSITVDEIECLIEFADVLDREGFIRHDINEASFKICAMYNDAYGMVKAVGRDILIDRNFFLLHAGSRSLSNIPLSVRDFAKAYIEYEGKEIACISYSIGNSRYENFRDPKCEVDGIKREIEFCLGPKDARKVLRAYGLIDEESDFYEMRIACKMMRELVSSESLILPKIMVSLSYHDSGYIESVIRMLKTGIVPKQKADKYKELLVRVAKLPFDYSAEAAECLKEEWLCSED